MRVTIETFDANGALKTAIATVPAHGHTGSSDGGQLNAGSVFSAGLVPLARGGTHTDLSATGGTSKALWQESAAADITVRVIADADLPTTLAGKTLTTPTIASFTNATHNHSDAAGGGNLGANAFSDQSANRFLVGPTSGGAAEPTFRVLDPLDITAGSMLPYTGFIVITYEVASGSSGGTFTSGSWQTRPLNTERVDTGGHASVASNQISLAAGTYRVRWFASVFAVNGSVSKLYNVTDTADLVVGTPDFSVAGAVPTHSHGEGRFTIAGTKTIELQHRCTSTRATDGMGTDASTTATNVFAMVVFERE